MREILFRGKRVANDEWVEGNFCMSALEQQRGLCGVDGYIRLYDFNKGKMEIYKVYRETVGQYTGLKDKNGKRLFEGDICRAKNLLHNGKEELFTVEWYENGFYLVDDTGTPWHPHHLEDIENIGNIHDNPELLGGDNA